LNTAAGLSSSVHRKQRQKLLLLLLLLLLGRVTQHSLVM
jgi:hypothetical protein